MDIKLTHMNPVSLVMLASSLVVSISAAAFGQSPTQVRTKAVSGGISFPHVQRYLGPGVTENGIPRNTADPDWLTTSPGYWVNGIFWATRSLSLHLGGEVAPSSTFTNIHQFISIRYVGEIHHRETTAWILFGVGTSNTRRVEIRGATGAGFVLEYTSELGTTTSTTIVPGLPSVRRVERTKDVMKLAWVSTVEVPIAVTSRVGVVPRLIAQWMPRPVPVSTAGEEVSDVFNRITLSPGIGIEVRF
jgi:hypothetical protein